MAGSDPLMMGGACERAREWASLRLDDELSVLEEEILERHLDFCEACRRFEEGMRLTTARIRSTPLETPTRRVPVPARSGVVTQYRKRTALVAAAALAIGALVGSLVERPGQSVPSESPSQVSFLSRDANNLRDIPRARFMTPVPSPAAPRNPPEGVI
ncbi:MAG TPA: zf-HC2 domain-containing protein [Gaiellaceae bacterium]|jgi:anti-sigma factor RsiW|nr:zf-HC2 domain-containing protein [Gaiellaceae bacterium]